MKTFKILFLCCCLMVVTQYSEAIPLIGKGPDVTAVLKSNSTDDVTLTVSADGATKDEAVKTALRSAIEQAYGAFVSANTSILNDELVKDEIVTVASGNIKSYSEISSNVMPNGRTFVTLDATVSISKLVKYAQNKGAETEFAGNTFGMNLKLKELNKQNERKVMENLFTQLKSINNLFDYELKLREPTMSENQSICIVSGEISLIFNSNTQLFYNILLNTLSSISLSDSELDEYVRTNTKRYTLTIKGTLNAHKPGKYYSHSWKTSDFEFELRNPYNEQKIAQMVSHSLYDFMLSDNISSPSNLRYECKLLKYNEPFFSLTKETYSLLRTVTKKRAIGQEFKIGECMGKMSIQIYIPIDEVSKYSSFRIEHKNSR